jgi:hypothetical protein
LIHFIRIALILFVVLSFFTVTKAQDTQGDYLKAKQYLQEENYVFAADQFRKLAGADQKHAFKEYSGFYYGLAAFKNGDFGLARSMWLQLATKNKGWDQIGEVYYWLAVVYFEEENYTQGVAYALRSKLPESEGLVFKRVSKLALNELTLLQSEFPNNKTIAFVTASKISAEPYS